MTPLRRPTRAADQFLQEENERLRTEIATLRERLREPEEILRAIRSGEVDGFVVSEGERDAVYHLRSADVLCRSMIEDMRESALAIDGAGTILFCNRCFAKMVGCAREEILGTRVHRFIAPETRPRFQEMLERAGHGASAEIELLASNGSHVSTEASAQLLSIESATLYGLVLRDLTRERLQERLAVESRRKDEFLAILGHELRGPLDPIRNAVQFLQLKAPDEPDLRWARDVIDRQVQHMTRLIDDLLDLGRIGQGKLELRLEEHTLQDVVTLAVETNRTAIEGRGHQLELVDETEPLPVQADPARLNQVLSNLLTNAAKFTPPGGRIVVTIERDGDHAAFRVRDNGMGIPNDRLAWIFDLFAQLESKPEGASGGLGIGLSMVRRLVEMHGGTVEASSDGLGTGTEFVVRLPISTTGSAGMNRSARPAPASVSPPTVETPFRAPAPPRLEVVPTAPRRRVLLVDDNGDARETLAQVLRLWGYELEAVEDGHAAIAAARKFRPDAIVMDIGLPGMDGHELARQLRQIRELDDTVLIALTGHGDDEARRRSAAAGIDHHAVKPAQLVELRALLDQRRRSAGA
jgi:PAS domain S-box-containing protein